MRKKTSKDTEELARQFRTTIPGGRAEPERYHRAIDLAYGSGSRPATPTTPQARPAKKERG